MTVTIVLGAIAGLVLFLYGVLRLSDAFRELAGDRLKTWLARFTINRFAGLLTGLVVTTVLDSSSVTIILVISLVSAGLLTFVQSLAVILGSNIGTTISSQIFASDLDAYAPVILAIGFLIYVLGRRPKLHHIGTALLGLGLIFFGLQQIEAAVEPMRENPRVREWLLRTETPWFGALVGAGVTVLLQSSSATMGIVIAMASQQLLTLESGVALMLGAEVGTCADTLVATVGRNRAAVRAGVFHLLFNIASASVGLLAVGGLLALSRLVSGNAPVERQIANAHVLFNVIGALLALGLLGPIARLLERAIPDRGPAPVSE